MSSFDSIDRIVIAGVGMIGGSIGLALKRSGFRGKVTGFGRRWSSLKNAINVGAIDSAAMDLAEAMDGAGILIVCTPVDTIPVLIGESFKYAPKGCIITDVGSTKSRLVADIHKIVPDDIYFVGAHPMAGSHKTGVISATDNLFDNSICILTPTEATESEALEVISDMWKSLGANVKLLPPQEHDYFIAAISHAPHILACAIIQVAADIKNNERAIDFSSTGFADMTRIASGSPDIWKGILLQNEMIVPILDKLENELKDIKSILLDKDEERLVEKLEQAKLIRDQIPAKR